MKQMMKSNIVLDLKIEDIPLILYVLRIILTEQEKSDYTIRSYINGVNTFDAKPVDFNSGKISTKSRDNFSFIQSLRIFFFVYWKFPFVLHKNFEMYS
jgi:hypothetical protein